MKKLTYDGGAVVSKVRTKEGEEKQKIYLELQDAPYEGAVVRIKRVQRPGDPDIVEGTAVRIKVEITPA